MDEVYKSMEKDRRILRGEIYYVSFYDSASHVVKGARPAVIISNDIHNRFSETVIVVPITTRRKDYPTHMDIETEKGIYGQIMCEQITTVDKDWIGDFKDTLTQEQMEELDRTIALELQLGGKDAFQYSLQVKKVEEAKKIYEKELQKLGMYSYVAKDEVKSESTEDFSTQPVESTPDRKMFVKEYETSTDKTATAKKYGFRTLSAASQYYRYHRKDK